MAQPTVINAWHNDTLPHCNRNFIRDAIKQGDSPSQRLPHTRLSN
jgi:hypothetical protein